MSWEIYDKDKFLDYLGSTFNLSLLMKKNNPAVNTFLNESTTREGASASTVKAAISELEKDEAWKGLADTLRRAKPPVRLSDGTEDWLEELYPNEDWLEPE